MKAVELGRIEPDAHRILGTISVNVADAIHPAERVLNITGDVVGDILFIHAAVGGDEGDRQDIGIPGFAYRYALVLDGLWELTHRRLQLVLHLLDGFIRVGSGGKAQRHGGLSGAAALG